jgi:transposase
LVVVGWTEEDRDGLSGDAWFQRQQADGPMEMRGFGTLTRDLLVLSDWLTEAGVTYVAMENTGEYWESVSNLVYGALTAFLVNDMHVKPMPGRETG